MALALNRAPVELTHEPAENGHSVAVAVSVTRLPDGRDKVVVSWIVTDAAGRAVGTVDQANAVPGGSLDRSRGAVAAQNADSAAGGVAALRRQSETAGADAGATRA